MTIMNNKGFTLIELMIVVVIIGILAAIAIPQYSQFTRKAKRQEAVTALTATQQAQAKLRGNCRWYGAQLVNNIDTGGGEKACEATALASRVLMRGYTAGTDPGTILSESGYYKIDITDASVSGNFYEAIAEAQGVQLQQDTDCKKLILTVSAANPNGVKTSEDSAGADSTAKNCW